MKIEPHGITFFQQEMHVPENISRTSEIEPPSLPTPKPGPPAATLVESKQREYTLASKRFRWLYWTTRLLAAVASCLLPFVVASYPNVAISLSVAIAVSVAIDSVFDPKGRHQIYSRASDLLGLAQLKAAGDLDAYKEQLDIILATEGQRLERLVDLGSLIKKIGETRP